MRLAGIVLYNPDLGRLRQNIDACLKQVNEITCVDNGSKNITEIEQFFREFQDSSDNEIGQESQSLGNNTHIEIIKNKKNLGIAKALNQILMYAQDSDYEWVLTLDQDSVILPGLLEGYESVIEDWNENNRDNINSNGLAMVTAVYQDRNSRLRPMTNGIFEEVTECITSASYANVKKLLNVGGYDEKMFIDYVDYDMCATLRENGYRIVRLNNDGFIHEVGRARTVRLLGVTTNVHNESAFRKYYQVRNHLYYIKKHRKSVNKWVEYRRIIKLFVLTILYETDRANKLKAMIKGIRDSRKMD